VSVQFRFHPTNSSLTSCDVDSIQPSGKAISFRCQISMYFDVSSFMCIECRKCSSAGKSGGLYEAGCLVKV